MIYSYKQHRKPYIVIFWAGPVGRQIFGGTYYLRLQCIICTMKMEAEYSLETSVTTFESKFCHNPEDNNVNDLHENLKFH